jgi:hypothetical protein
MGTNCQTIYVSELAYTYQKNQWKNNNLKILRQTCMSSSDSRAQDGTSSLGNICTFALVCLCISDNDPSLPSKQAISLEGTSSLVVITLSLSGPRSTI